MVEFARRFRCLLHAPTLVATAVSPMLLQGCPVSFCIRNTLKLSEAAPWLARGLLVCYWSSGAA
eukprot:8363838-Alexandrium_andersonii.AAC.1